MLNPLLAESCSIDAAERAKLIIVIDTEEEFNWSLDFARQNTSVRSIRSLEKIQLLFEEYRIRPVYVLDYPVAFQSDGYRPLQEIHASGRCLIGAHLHPWVNPPFEEEVSRRNSFPGNLPRSLEATKLRILGDLIGERFSTRPVIYKAGRYGVGANTADILEEQGYAVDLSVCPYMDYSPEGGPDFTKVPALPYWFGNNSHLLEIPTTVGFVGGCVFGNACIVLRVIFHSIDYIWAVSSHAPDCSTEYGFLPRATPWPKTSLLCAASTETDYGFSLSLSIAHPYSPEIRPM